MSRRPVGKMTAIIPPYKSGGSARFVNIGQVWRTRSGKFICTLDVQPVVWNDPYVQRTLLIELNEEANHPLQEEDPELLPAERFFGDDELFNSK